MDDIYWNIKNIVVSGEEWMLTLLFDFDGTIVDSFNCVVDKAVLLAEAFHFRKIEEHEREHLRTLSSMELIKFLGIPLYQIPTLIYHMRKYLHVEMEKLPPVADIDHILEKLHAKHFTLGILTSNSIENVALWLRVNKMDHFFKFIHCESNFVSKKYLLHKTLKTYQLDPAHTFLVGDETRDIEAAHKNGVKSIAATWGYNAEDTLMKFQPAFIAKKPADLITICAG